MYAERLETLKTQFQTEREAFKKVSHKEVTQVRKEEAEVCALFLVCFAGANPGFTSDVPNSDDDRLAQHAALSRLIYVHVIFMDYSIFHQVQEALSSYTPTNAGTSFMLLMKWTEVP